MVEAEFPDVIATRYASERMRTIWSPRHRVVLERRLWLAVLRAQQELGADIDPAAPDAYEAVVEEVDMESISRRESITRHDVKARIDEFCALAGHEQIHLGMTSRDLTENVEQYQVVEALKVIRDDLVAVIARLASSAKVHAGTVMVARTHNVAAQATTLGKRFADATSETMLGHTRIEELLGRYPLRGIKGAVGTRLDQLDLLGSSDAVDELDRRVAKHLGFDRVLVTAAQIYPRSLDLDVVAALVQAVSGATSLAMTLRLMAGEGLVSEGFGAGQVGSSAMPHKVNARSCERIAALRALLDGHLTTVSSLAGRQWNEGDVSCSAARRVMLPDAFCVADGLLHTTLGVINELQIDEEAIAAELRRFMPLLATTRLLTALVKSGVGREQAHELLAEPSRQAARSAQTGTPPDFQQILDRLSADPRTSQLQDRLKSLLSDPTELIGTAIEQTMKTVAQAEAIASHNRAAAQQQAEVRL